MDMISEILETDRLAEEKLEAAMQRRSELLAECQKQTEQLINDAKAKAESYRSSLPEEGGEASAELKKSEQDKLRELSEAYEKNHETWENDIFAAITG